MAVPTSSRRARPIAAVGLAVLALAPVLAACAPGVQSGSTTQPPTVPDPLENLDQPAPGKGAAVIGIEQLAFTVTACTSGPGQDDTPEATQEFRLEGQGTTSDGKFWVEVTRYRSDTGAGAPVITETALVQYGEGDRARGLEAKRSTAGADGAWLDLTDPEADEPLLRRQGRTVDIRARFGPETAREGDDRLVEGRLRATCPS